MSFNDLDLKKTKNSIQLQNLQRINRNTTRICKGISFIDIFKNMPTNEILFCQNTGLIAVSAICHCGKNMKLVIPKQSKPCYWFCCVYGKENPHKCRYSVRKGTFFENSALSITDILKLSYMWVYEYSNDAILHECSHTPATVLEYYKSFVDACKYIMEYKSEPLGGADKIVEIFECPFNDGNKKNKWVFCALEHSSCKSVLVIMQDKQSKSILQLFEHYIKSESIILTNVWNFFKDITEENFNYLTNEKSIIFYDDVSKSEIDSMNKMKTFASRPPAINASTKYVHGTKFYEKMYRKSLKFSEDPFLTFLQDLAKIYPPVTTCLKTSQAQT